MENYDLMQDAKYYEEEKPITNRFVSQSTWDDSPPLKSLKSSGKSNSIDYCSPKLKKMSAPMLFQQSIFK
jgi:hypothetical protein